MTAPHKNIKPTDAEPKWYSIVFNANPKVKSVHTPSRISLRVDPGDNEKKAKEKLFEAALWAGGAIAMIIAIGTLVI
jgi:hypothetical protein